MGSEHTNIREAWRGSKHRELFGLDTCVAATTKSLRQGLLDLPEDGKHVLHFVGDSDKGLCIPTEDNTPPIYLEPNKLATLVGLFRETVSTVVLSGCYEEAQARAVSSLGTAGADMFVVGLKSGLTPDQRITASVNVYNALCSGRDEAFMAKFVQSVVGMEEIPEHEVVIWHNGRVLGNEKPVLPSPSFSAQTARSVGFERFDDHHVFFCDREVQEQQFVQILPTATQLGPFAFFGIHGDDPQSHAGLIQRFFHYFLRHRKRPEQSMHAQVVLRDSHSLEGYKAEVRTKLLAAFQASSAIVENDRNQWLEILDFLEDNNKLKVAVEFQVRSPYWKPFTPEIIQWFIDDYCKPEYLGSNPPQFYFFLSIVYEQAPDHVVLLQHIRETVKKLPKAEILDELRPVTQDHIRDWIQEYMSPNPAQVRELLLEICYDNLPSYNMDEVERRLHAFIKKYALQDPDFKS